MPKVRCRGRILSIRAGPGTASHVLPNTPGRRPVPALESRRRQPGFGRDSRCLLPACLASPRCTSLQTFRASTPHMVSRRAKCPLPLPSILTRKPRQALTQQPATAPSHVAHTHRPRHLAGDRSFRAGAVWARGGLPCRAGRTLCAACRCWPPRSQAKAPALLPSLAGATALTPSRQVPTHPRDLPGTSPTSPCPSGGRGTSGMAATRPLPHCRRARRR